MGEGCIIAGQDGHKIDSDIGSHCQHHCANENTQLRGGETGVTLGIKAYIVYSKSGGDNRDLEQAVILTSDDP